MFTKTTPRRTSTSPWYRISRDEPTLYAPPCTQTITGSPSPSGGEMTFSVRQSSEIGTLDAGPRNCPFRSCGATAPKSVASSTPSHGRAGAGARNLRSPTGGAAYGIPRHILSPRRSTPSTVPLVVSTLTRAFYVARVDGRSRSDARRRSGPCRARSRR